MMKQMPEHTISPAVMIVDDEEMVLRSISNLFELETDYKIFTHLSPKDALVTARREKIDCVITDFLMPDMDGLEFLRALTEVAPDVPAIMLTGYADKENAIKAINEVRLFQYLEKPWDNDHLRVVVRNAIGYRTLEQALSERLRELDRAIQDRDVFRQTAEQLEAELRLAEEVQRSILPRGRLEDEHFRFYHRYYPTGQLGGDFFDVAFSGPGQFCAIVADVAGHGVAAALGTMLVKVLFTDMSEHQGDCGAMLVEMNGRLNRLLAEAQFVTAFILQCDGPGRLVRAASAGGPHPILFSRDTARPIEQWILNGLPLGAFPNRVFRQPEMAERALVSGDRVLLYTDGLLDSNVDRGDSVDPTEIVKTLESLRALDGDALLDALAESRGIGGRQLPDDVNLLLIDYE